MTETARPASRKPWPDYRAVWRWHFYAGLFCIPFVIVLSISGSIYLFKEEIESWIDRPCDHLEVRGQPAAPAEQARAALAAIPNSTLRSYELPQAPDAAARVVVADEVGDAIRVYLHPESLQVLKSVAEEDRFMRQIFRIHGELLLGNRGSALVELASSWAIIMIVTGLYLWWPRGSRGLGGVAYPRLGRSSRIFWRDLHGVAGFWISGFALILLLSGLPWAKFWGDYLRNIRRITGTAVVQQDWTNGSASRPSLGTSGDHSGHHQMSGAGRGRAEAPVDLSALDRVVAAVQPLQLPPPVVIAPPGRGSSNWSAKSMTANRPFRVDLEVDGATGTIVSRRDFRDKHLIDRVVGTGIAVHEGRLFGLPNQLLGLATAIGLVLLSVSAVILWWRRRDRGALGAPAVLTTSRFTPGFLALVVAFGLYLPLFGISLIAVVLLEKAVFGRIPRARAWLGLEPPKLRAVKPEAVG